MDAVKVAVRIRPLISSEEDYGCRRCIEKVPGEPQVCVGKDGQSFCFNHVFDEKSGQIQIYSDAVNPLLDNLFKGYNVTILAYGQTGSGKTYTMGTNYNGVGELGVIPRALIEIFSKIKATEHSYNYTVSLSFLELYNECFYDLFTNKTRDESVVELREGQNGVFIPGLSQVEVTSLEETLQYLQQGSAERVTGSTAMNANSSRSHAIFTVNICKTSIKKPNDVVRSKFQLVDLAGSERSKKTGSSGDRFKEGVNINKGLFVLGNVISQLGENVPFVNYRDSKLTRLLQDSLGGNSMTLMIACVSPADCNQEETLSTLRYAVRAKKIKNKPVVNKDPQVLEIGRLKKENEELRLKIISCGSACPPEHKTLEKELLLSQQKTVKLSETLDRVLKQNMGHHERELLIDSWCEKFGDKLICLDFLCESCDQDSNLFNEQVDEIKVKLNELKSDHQEFVSKLVLLEKKTYKTPKSTSVENEGESSKIGNVTDSVAHGQENYIFTQARITKKIEDITYCLAWKEELVNKLSVSQNGLVKLKDESEGKISDLNQQLADVLLEKDQLAMQIQFTSSGSNTPAAKLAEERRVKLEQLEQKHAQLLRRVAEQEKVIKMKESADKKLAQVKKEMCGLKQLKVKLVHELRAESNKYRNLKNEKEREVHKLRSQNAKSQNTLIRMERLHSLQQNVLKRKLEAAAAANKRIMEALARRKKSEKQLKATTSTERISEKITEDLEIAMSAFNAEKSLNSLIQDRAELKKELEASKRSWEDQNQVLMKERKQFNKKVKHFQDEIELRSTQIADLQQKLLDAQQEERVRFQWESLQSMSDAKFALNYLFSIAADLKKELINKDLMYQELKESEESVKKELENNKTKMKEMTWYYQRQNVEVEREYEEKIYLLLKESKHEGDNERILNEELQKMEALQQEVFDLKTKIVELESAGKVTNISPEIVPKIEVSDEEEEEVATCSSEVSVIEVIDIDDIEVVKHSLDDAVPKEETCENEGFLGFTSESSLDEAEILEHEVRKNSSPWLKKRPSGKPHQVYFADVDDSPEKKRKRLEETHNRTYFE